MELLNHPPNLLRYDNFLETLIFGGTFILQIDPVSST